MASPDSTDLWTIGHSTLPYDTFARNLEAYGIDVVADVRSWPHSRIAPWFDRPALSAALAESGIKYVWLGEQLGGRPDDSGLYTPDGRVRYDAVAATRAFRSGIDRLHRGMARMRVAMLCAEEDPTHCHRRLLVGRVLASEGVRLHHIRRDGTIDGDRGFVTTANLFGEVELPWTSTASVSQRRARRTSSVA